MSSGCKNADPCQQRRLSRLGKQLAAPEGKELTNEESAPAARGKKRGSTEAKGSQQSKKAKRGRPKSGVLAC